MAADSTSHSASLLGKELLETWSKLSLLPTMLTAICEAGRADSLTGSGSGSGGGALLGSGSIGALCLTDLLAKHVAVTPATQLPPLLTAAQQQLALSLEAAEQEPDAACSAASLCVVVLLWLRPTEEAAAVLGAPLDGIGELVVARMSSAAAGKKQKQKQTMQQTQQQRSVLAAVLTVQRALAICEGRLRHHGYPAAEQGGARGSDFLAALTARFG